MHWAHRFFKWLLIFQMLKISSNWWHFSTLFIQWDKRNWIYMEMCIHLCIFKEMTHWLSYLHLEYLLSNWYYKLPIYYRFILHMVLDINFMKEDLLCSWEYQGSFLLFLHRWRFGKGINASWNKVQKIMM